MSQKNILITGAEGFIAINLASYLSKKHFNIFGIGNKKFEKKISSKFGYKFLLNSKVNKKNLKKNFGGIDLIIHCAGSGIVGLNKQENYKKNFLTTKGILDFSRNEKKKPRIIFMSSYSIYGNSYLKAIKENCKPKPLSSYAITKRDSENILLKYSKLYCLDITILRLASIYGNGLKKQLIFDTCNKIRNNKNIFYGTGNEIRDWLHISDLCTLVYKVIIKSSEKKIINCGSGKGNKVKTIIGFIKKEFNSTTKIKYVMKKNKEAKVLKTNINLAKSFGWYPKISLKKGILKYVRWYKKIYD
jgi:UDP-glucose 4-epimerase